MLTRNSFVPDLANNKITNVTYHKPGHNVFHLWSKRQTPPNSGLSSTASLSPTLLRRLWRHKYNLMSRGTLHSARLLNWCTILDVRKCYVVNFKNVWTHKPLISSFRLFDYPRMLMSIHCFLFIFHRKKLQKSTKELFLKTSA